jgi:glycosyltransferase involved in cell wall biosynthesis
MSRPMLVVFATFDPRGMKIGGIETHTRHILRHFPEGSDLLLVGLDEAGDLTPGVAVDIAFEGRPIRFMPLAHIPAEVSSVAAQKLAGSTTLRFVLAGLRHLPALRRAVRGRRASADLPRVEFAPLARLMGLPYLLTIHSQIATPEKTASLLQHYRALRRFSERFGLSGAQHVFAVTPTIHEQLLAAYPVLAPRSSVLPVPVDTGLFYPTPLPQGEVFHLAYAGRFGSEKDPALMFSTINALARRLNGQVRFHVMGPGNPAEFPEFAAIAPITEQHGALNTLHVAEVIRSVHCGMLTSKTEGLPCFLLETLASGRCFGSVMLPSLVPFVLEGETGLLVERAGDTPQSAEAIAAGLETIWQGIKAGAYDPDGIAARVEPYAARRLFKIIFEHHARIVAPPDAPGLALAP